MRMEGESEKECKCGMQFLEKLQGKASERFESSFVVTPDCIA